MSAERIFDRALQAAAGCGLGALLIAASLGLGLLSRPVLWALLACLLAVASVAALVALLAFVALGRSGGATLEHERVSARLTAWLRTHEGELGPEPRERLRRAEPMPDLPAMPPRRRAG